MFLISCLLACGAPTPAGSTPALDTATAPTGGTDSGLEQAPLDLVEASAANLVWISVDTFRRDALGRYGGGPTPFLDEFLAQGLALDGHRSCASWTLPSMLCQLMGRTPLDAGFFPGFSTDGTSATPDGLTTLATGLAAAGFRSAWLSANPLVGDALPDVAAPMTLTIREQADAVSLTVEALALAQAVGSSGDRWSLLVHYTDTHSPYSPPAAYLTALDALQPSPVDLEDPSVLRSLARGELELSEEELALVITHLETRYAGAARFLDDQIAVLWQGLLDGGLLEDTLVVVSSDHGEQFFEHAKFTHGRSLHAEEVDGVAGLWLDGVAPATWAGQTLSEDLGVTVARVLGLDPLDGATGLRVGQRAQDSPAHAFFMREDGLPAHALDLEGWRLFYDWDGTTALYEGSGDPLEQDPRASTEPETVSRLSDALVPFLAQAQAVFPELEPAEPAP